MSDRPDRRIYERFDLLAQVRVRQGTLDHVFEILNLSRGGVLIDLGSEPRPRWLELRRELEVRLFDGEGGTILDSHGKVVRIVEALDSRSFAIEFDQPQDEVTVRRALRSAGKPPPLPAKS